MGVLGRVSVAAVGVLGVGLGVGAAPAVAGPPAPNGLTPFVAQLKALERHEPPDPAALISGWITGLKASESLDTQALNAELNGISQGLQQIGQQQPGDPHNGLISTIVNELNDYVNAHGGTVGGGGGGGGTGPGA